MVEGVKLDLKFRKLELELVCEKTSECNKEIFIIPFPIECVTDNLLIRTSQNILIKLKKKTLIQARAK